MCRSGGGERPGSHPQTLPAQVTGAACGSGHPPPHGPLLSPLRSWRHSLQDACSLPRPRDQKCAGTLEVITKDVSVASTGSYYAGDTSVLGTCWLLGGSCQLPWRSSGSLPDRGGSMKVQEGVMGINGSGKNTIIRKYIITSHQWPHPSRSCVLCPAQGHPKEPTFASIHSHRMALWKSEPVLGLEKS